MIGKLTGIVDTLEQNHLILDVGGVGYLVQCSGSTLRQIGKGGEVLSLLIETHVREDAIVLYGFIDALERDWFRILITVQGVGARLAMSLLTTLPPQQLTQAIAAQDKKALSQAEGVGPKLANRIASELKDKAANTAFGNTINASSSSSSDHISSGTKTITEVVSALINLGYKRTEAFAAVTTISNRLGAEATVERLIREALRELSAQ